MTLASKPAAGTNWTTWGDSVDATMRDHESRFAMLERGPVVGMYAGWDNQAGINTFETTYGVNIPYGHEFGDNTRWDWFENGTNFDNWATWVAAKSGRRFTYSSPLLTVNGDSNYTTTDGKTTAQKYGVLAAGGYDAHFTNLGSAFQSRPALRNAIVRLGWEFNGDTFPWKVPPADATTLANYKIGFAKAVAALNAACPTLEVEWAPNCQLNYTNKTFDDLYPTTAAIDYIGIGLYDYCWGHSGYTAEQRWAWMRDGDTGVNGLNDQVRLARKYGKKLAHTEYGMWPSSDTGNGGGGDRPEFIHQMNAWWRTHGYSYQIYNNVTATEDHTLTVYPKSMKAYLAYC